MPEAVSTVLASSLWNLLGFLTVRARSPRCEQNDRIQKTVSPPPSEIVAVQRKWD